MAATLVLYEGILGSDENYRSFTTSSGETFLVALFKDGVAHVFGSTNFESIESFFEMIVGCFHEQSNFKSELFEAFNCDENTTFTGIRIYPNEGVTILVTKENAKFEDINEKYWECIKAIKEKKRLEREAYMKTPEYRAKRIREIKALLHKQRIMNEIRFVDKSTEIEFEDDYAKREFELWAESSGESGKFAQRWAKYMQHLMKKHNKSLSQIAYNAYLLCGGEKIDPYDYDQKVRPMLSSCWKYGHELNNWSIPEDFDIWELIEEILSH